MFLQLAGELTRRLDPFLQRHERGHCLPFDLMRTTDDRSLSDAWIIDECAFNLHRPDPMPRDIQHVVNASEQPIEPVVVSPGPIAGEVRAVRPLAPVGLDEALRISMDRAKH